MRLKCLATLFLICSCACLCNATDTAMPDNPGGGTGTTYYVDDANGNDSNNGRSEQAAWKTFNHAKQAVSAGDLVLIKNGTYYNAGDGKYKNWQISKRGTVGQYITFRAFPGHRPRFTVDTWNGIELYNCSYIEIDGFEVVGLPDPASIVGKPAGDPARKALTTNDKYIGGGINVIQGCDHIRIRNCVVHQVGGNGIAGGAHVFLIENNTIYNVAHRSEVGNSGISAGGGGYGGQAAPANYGVVIRNNTIYDAKNMLGFIHYAGGRHITDGNGIIIDLANDTAYRHRILIANNIVYNCGGRGVHAYGSSNIDIINNTLYHNLRSAAVPGDLGAVMRNEGELSSVNARTPNVGNTASNNIAIARPGLRAYKIDNNAPIANNLFISTVAGQNPGGSNIVGQDPQFTDPGQYDFSLQASSPAIDSGRTITDVHIDQLGTPRPQGSGYDIGAREKSATPGPQSQRQIRMRIDGSIPLWQVLEPASVIINPNQGPWQEFQLARNLTCILRPSNISAAN